MPSLLPPTSTLELSTLGNVPAAYVHHRRLVAPGDQMVVPGVALKWHHLHRAETAIPLTAIAEARALVQSELAAGTIERGHGLGFVVLHYSTALAYLLVGTWYQTQELWLTLFVRDLAGNSGYERKQPGLNWSTACVWELAPIWHERQAWTAYLDSMRDDAAKQEYLDDVLTGPI